jgi:hypothetical protein
MRKLLIYITFMVGLILGSFAGLELLAQTYNFSGPISVVATTANNLRGQLHAIVGPAGYVAEVDSSNRLKTLTTIDNPSLSDELNRANVVGCVDHDVSATACDPLLVGAYAVAFGANPTGVAVNDGTRLHASRAGQLFTIGGHPNTTTIEAQVQDADGAQADAALVTVAAGSKIVVTEAHFTCNGTNTVAVTATLAFGTATVPARAHTGVAKIVLAVDELAPGATRSRGDGSGVIGSGADDEDLRLTMEDPVTGSCGVLVSYFTVES